MSGTDATKENYMKTIGSVAIAVAILAGPALGQAKPKLTVAQALSLLSALRNLDGHLSVVKQGGQDVTIMVPWEFGSGALRARIAGDISLLNPIEKSADDSRRGILKEIIAKMPDEKDGSRPQSVLPGTAEFTEFQRQYNEVLNGDSPISDMLARIKASELKLDKNEIPVTALSALEPILDNDLAAAK
jgi:hypothetical protein